MHRTSLSSPLLAAVIGLIILADLSPSLPAVAFIDTAQKFQTMEGFGGGFVFGTYPYGRACKDELYDSLFNKAGISIVRIGNPYDPEKNNTIDEIPMLREIRQKWPNVKVVLASWSPPAYLKSNGAKAGLKGIDTGTIKKDNGLFAYDAYGEYWFKTARHFQDSGVAVNWISIQNEPDYAPLYDGCVLRPVESATMASYGKALAAVYGKLASLPDPIPLIGPDLLGISDSMLQAYMASPDMHVGQLAAICHHLYTGADSTAMHSVAQSFPSTPLYQTEYLINEDPSEQAWFDHAQLIQRALVIEGVSMYDVFTLTYRQRSTHCLFSLDSAGGGFTTRPMYYAFKHFSKSIHRGWRRIRAAVDEPGVTISAFMAPSGDSLAAVVINGASTAISLSLPLPLSAGRETALYRTTATGKYAFEGNYSGSVTMEPRSIMTLETPRQAAGVIPRRLFPHPSASPRLLRAVALRAGELYVSNGAPFSNRCTVSLFDASGRKIGFFSPPKANDRGGPLTLPVNGSFANGIYFLRLE
jgi:glucuronoarabinoxylan endo-1,4-beta-xylanase